MDEKGRSSSEVKLKRLVALELRLMKGTGHAFRSLEALASMKFNLCHVDQIYRNQSCIMVLQR